MGELGLIARAAAVTLVLTRSSLFRVFREHGPAGWQRFAKCPLCVGVWIGLVWSAFDLFARDALPASALESPLNVAAAAAFAVGNGALAGAVALLYVTAIDGIEAIALAADRFAAPDIKNE